MTDFHRKENTKNCIWTNLFDIAHQIKGDVISKEKRSLLLISGYEPNFKAHTPDFLAKVLSEKIKKAACNSSAISCDSWFRQSKYFSIGVAMYYSRKLKFCEFSGKIWLIFGGLLVIAK